MKYNEIQIVEINNGRVHAADTDLSKQQSPRRRGGGVNGGIKCHGNELSLVSVFVCALSSLCKLIFMHSYCKAGVPCTIMTIAREYKCYHVYPPIKLRLEEAEHEGLLPVALTDGFSHSSKNIYMKMDPWKKMNWYISNYPAITCLIYMFNRHNIYHTISKIKIIKFLFFIFI